MLVAGISVYAQDGAYTGYTPYSIFGIGDLNSQGSAYNRSMGGVGIATRNKRYLNYMNPAAVTARDTISVLADMSLNINNKVFKQDDIRSANNNVNINDIALSFPIYKSYAAMMVGLSPYSSTGYGYSSILDDPYIVGNTGNAVYYSMGSGSVYRFFAAAGVTFWKRLSLGVEGIGYFGKIEKENKFQFAKSAYSAISSGQTLMLHGLDGKFGLQYEQPIGNKVTVGVGATYSLGSNLKGYVDDYKYSIGASQTDTLRYTRDTLAKSLGSVRIPSEIGVGVSVNYADNWRFEVNYTRSDWTSSGMDSKLGFANVGTSSFGTNIAEAYRAGFEIVPNRNDIRYYYRRIAYRAGVYYQSTYYSLDGNQAKNYGLTLGASLPVFKNFNAVNFAVDLGQRASLANSMIRERYINFTVGFNFHDYWFQKPAYN